MDRKIEAPNLKKNCYLKLNVICLFHLTFKWVRPTLKWAQWLPGYSAMGVCQLEKTC